MRAQPVGTLDFETDPFLHGRAPKPFACEILINNEAWTAWGGDCVRETVKELRAMPRCILYAHNGGKFDFWYLIHAANKGEPVKVINGRIAQFKIGKVTLTDSWLLLPVPLAAYAKDKIDYRLFEERVRNKHKRKILDYLHKDCVYTLDMITAARKRYGNKLTIGGAAIAHMRKCGHVIDKCGSAHDQSMRSWYFGGRTQALKPGDHQAGSRGNFTYYDINSAYPHAMTYKHCMGGQYWDRKREPRPALYGPSFFMVIAESAGWFPVRALDDPGKPLDYPQDGEPRRFHVTGWELMAALDAGLRLDKIEMVCVPKQTQDFGEFVHTTRKERADAKARGDKLGDLLAKLLGNSGYGKLASDPARYRDYKIAERDALPVFKRREGDFIEGEWEADVSDELSLYSVPADGLDESYFNVATAASITGFVRARLITAIHSAREPLYCDTDSLVCRSADIEIGDGLGQWKVEARIKRAVIVGRKLYALQDTNGEWRTASKGAVLDHKEILAIAKGKPIKWRNAAPAFSFGGTRFTTRSWNCQD